MISKFVWNAFNFCLRYILRLSKNTNFFKLHLFLKAFNIFRKTWQKKSSNNFGGMPMKFVKLTLPTRFQFLVTCFTWIFFVLSFFLRIRAWDSSASLTPIIWENMFGTCSPQKSPSRSDPRNITDPEKKPEYLIALSRNLRKGGPLGSGPIEFF